jgi:hypothetical protein
MQIILDRDLLQRSKLVAIACAIQNTSRKQPENPVPSNADQRTFEAVRSPSRDGRDY